MALGTATPSRRARKVLAAAALSFGLATLSPCAHAALVFDIRNAADGSKSAFVSTIGQVVHYDVFVTVTGNDANLANDTLQSAYAYIRSVGSILGDLTHTNVSEWSVNNDSDGAVGDRDADGDLDIGGAGTLNTTAGQIHYRAGSQTPAPTPLRIGGGTFTVKSLAGGLANITFSLATPSGLNRNPSWVMDGVSRNGDNTTLIQVGAPLVVSTEERFVPWFDLQPAPDTPTFTLLVAKGDQPGQYVTPNPLNAGDELPAGGINSGGVVISGIEPSASPVFILLGLSNENALDGRTVFGGGTLIPESDPTYLALKANYPFLDALVRFSGDADRVFNFDVGHGTMITEIAAVPEPSAIALTLPALALLSRRRRW